MNITKRYGILISILNLSCVLLRAASFDVVVIGGTPAGVAAAIAAARAGRTAVIVEQSPVLGGMLSSGVSRADDAVIQANNGIFEEFRQRVAKYHQTELANDPVVKQHLAIPRVRHSVAHGQAWEAKTAARIYAAMAAETGKIETRFQQIPVRALLDGDRVTGVIARDNTGAEHRYEGKIIIDATYEGDVAAQAGVPFRMGREARSPEEPHAGLIYTDAFCEGTLTLPGTILPGSTGQADEKIQAYNYRFLVKDYGRPDHPYRLKTPPPGYDPWRYKWDPSRKPYLPNGKIDVLGINWGNDWAGPSYRYPIASWEERKKIEETYRNHALGYLYYIQTEGRSPQYGLADDEFTDNGNFPYRLYVREGRRIEGLYTLTESDIHKDLRGNGVRGPLHRDSIAIGIYEIDSHNVQNPKDRNKPCSGEGAINLIEVTGAYQIPYGVMAPRNRRGLLAPVAISSTHVAISSVRMEPVWSSLGHAAGVAAGLALNRNLDVREVPVSAIQEELVRQGSYLFFYMDVPGSHPAFADIQKLSTRGALDGDENYYFRPDQPITRGDFAKLAVVGLQIPLSITAAHFIDLPRAHAAFKYLETLYDNSSRSGKPFLDFEAREYLSYRTKKHNAVYVYPDRAITAGEAWRIVQGVLGRDLPAPANSAAVLSRADAARMVAGFLTN